MSQFKRTFKRLLLAGGLGLATLVAILLTNTARFSSRQLRVEPIDKAVLDESLVAKRLGRAIQFPTVSHQQSAQFDGKPFLDLHAYLRQSFPKVHATLTRESVGGYSLLYTWQGTDPSRKPILLMSHLDVVAVEGESERRWTHPPFSGKIVDDHIWGRGALDVKCGVLGILEAVELLLADGFQPASTICLAFGHDEEIGGLQGNAQIALLLRGRGVRFQTVHDEGGVITNGIVAGVSAPVATVNVVEKGYFSVEMSVEQPGGHSSMPPPQTAVGIIAAAVGKLETNPFPTNLQTADLMFDYLGPELLFTQRMAIANRWLFSGLIAKLCEDKPSTNALVRTTMAATMIDGGVKENVLPTNARAIVNVRTLPGESVERVLEQIRATINDDRVKLQPLESFFSEASYVSDSESQSFETIHRTIRQVFPEVLVAPGLLVGGTDSRHYEGLTENTFRFIPIRLTAEDLKRIHGTDERISVENYADLIRFFIQLIRNSAT